MGGKSKGQTYEKVEGGIDNNLRNSRSQVGARRHFPTTVIDVIPTSKGWYAKMEDSVGIRTNCIHVFAYSLAKISASELSRKFIKRLLLVGISNVEGVPLCLDLLSFFLKVNFICASLVCCRRHSGRVTQSISTLHTHTHTQINVPSTVNLH